MENSSIKLISIQPDLGFCAAHHQRATSVRVGAKGHIVLYCQHCPEANGAGVIAGKLFAQNMLRELF